MAESEKQNASCETGHRWPAPYGNLPKPGDPCCCGAAQWKAIADVCTPEIAAEKRLPCCGHSDQQHARPNPDGTVWCAVCAANCPVSVRTAKEITDSTTCVNCGEELRSHGYVGGPRVCKRQFFFAAAADDPNAKCFHRPASVPAADQPQDEYICGHINPKTRHMCQLQRGHEREEHDDSRGERWRSAAADQPQEKESDDVAD